MTSKELAGKLSLLNPTRKFAVTDSEVGVWSEGQQRWYSVYALLITGEWMQSPPYEILVNGEAIPRQWEPLA